MDAQKDRANRGVQSTSLQIFNFDSVTVRTFNLQSEVWFSAADVCAALGISNYRQAVSRLDDDEARVISTDTPSKNQHGEFGTVLQDILVINESGLYSLTLTSRKPEAKRFKRWVTHDVLPAIRKQGFYITQHETPSIDAGSLMLSGQSEPRVERPAYIDSAIDRRAWDMAREAYELSRAHLQRRVAFMAESGYREPTLNEQAALSAIDQTTLDSALTHAWLDKVQSLRAMVSSFLCAGVNLVEELDAIEQRFNTKPKQQHLPGKSNIGD